MNVYSVTKIYFQERVMKVLKVIVLIMSVILLLNCFVGCSKTNSAAIKENGEQAAPSDETLIKERIQLFLKAYNEGDMETVMSCLDAKSRNAFQAMLNLVGGFAGSKAGFNINLADLFALGVNTTSVDFMDLKIEEINMSDEKNAVVTTTMNLAGSGKQTIYFIMVYENDGWYINDMTDQKMGGVDVEDIDTSFLTETTPSEGLDFALNAAGDGYILTGMGTCTDSHVVIPEYPVEYNKIPVTVISFSYIRAEYVTVPKSVTTINGYYGETKAINYLGSFEEWLNVNYNQGGTSIFSQGALLYVNGNPIMGEMELTADLETIPKNAFLGYAHITSLNISTPIIGENAFYGCDNLKKIQISNGVKEIGKNAFRSCLALEQISLGNAIEEMGQEAFHNTAYYSNTKNWENGVLYVDEYLYSSLDDVINLNVKAGTVGIWSYAFENKSHLKTVNLSDSVRIIGNSAFYYCKLDKVVFGSGLRTVKKNAFRYASVTSLQADDLSSITIEDGNNVLYN